MEGTKDSCSFIILIEERTKKFQYGCVYILAVESIGQKKAVSTMGKGIVYSLPLCCADRLGWFAVFPPTLPCRANVSRCMAFRPAHKIRKPNVTDLSISYLQKV